MSDTLAYRKLMTQGSHGAHHDRLSFSQLHPDHHSGMEAMEALVEALAGILGDWGRRQRQEAEVRGRDPI